MLVWSTYYIDWNIFKIAAEFKKEWQIFWNKSQPEEGLIQKEEH